MFLNRTILAMALALGVSACASVEPPDSIDTASRASAGPEAVLTPTEVALPSVRVRNIVVDVPRTLRVNEKNSYKPRGEIVWREDPIGNRYDQVRKIMEDGLRAGTDQLKGDAEVDLHVEVTMFHAQSQKARYSIGGIHEIRFYMTLVDPVSGKPLTRPHFVKADFEALGGKAAVAAEAQGITQKVRIQQQLAYVIQLELTDPEGYTPQIAGVMGLVDRF